MPDNNEDDHSSGQSMPETPPDHSPCEVTITSTEKQDSDPDPVHVPPPVEETAINVNVPNDASPANTDTDTDAPPPTRDEEKADDNNTPAPCHIADAAVELPPTSTSDEPANSTSTVEHKHDDSEEPPAAVNLDPQEPELAVKPAEDGSEEPRPVVAEGSEDAQHQAGEGVTTDDPAQQPPSENNNNTARCEEAEAKSSDHDGDNNSEKREKGDESPPETKPESSNTTEPGEANNDVVPEDWEGGEEEKLPDSHDKHEEGETKVKAGPPEDEDGDSGSDGDDDDDDDDHGEENKDDAQEGGNGTSGDDKKEGGGNDDNANTDADADAETTSKDKEEEEKEEEEEKLWKEEKWTDEIVFDHDDPATVVDESPSRLEWLRQKQEEGAAENKFLDRMMCMVGHEEVKARFLAVKARVEVAKRWDEDLKDLRFDLVLCGNDGTGKRRIAQLYAGFLRTIGAIPADALLFKTEDDALRCSRWCTAVAFFVNAKKIKDKAKMEAIMEEVKARKWPTVLILSYRNRTMGKEIVQQVFGATYESRIRFAAPISLRDYTESEMLQLLRRPVSASEQQQQSAPEEAALRILARRATAAATWGRGSDEEKEKEKDGGGGLPSNAHALLEELYKARSRRALRLEKEWVAWAKEHSPPLPAEGQKETDMQRPPRGGVTLEDVLGPEPLDIRSKSEAWKKIQAMVGLEGVKKEIEQLFHLARANYEREMRGKPRIPVNLNRSFLGNPGVGKTTVAALYGQVLGELGLVSKGEVILKNPTDLLSVWVGDSERKTHKLLEQARGSVLVIDDAHMLYQSRHGSNDSDSFRKGIIDVLVASISGSPGEDRCVILAGYADKMEEMFLNANPGLQRRFPLESAIRFPDYDDDELCKILDLKMARDGTPHASEEGRKVAREVLAKMRSRPRFGNGGDVENLLARAQTRRRQRLKAAGIRPLVGRLCKDDDEDKDGGEEEEEPPLEAQDFDPDYDRATRADEDRRALFGGFVGFEKIVTRFKGYQKMADGMRRHGIDPRSHIPWAFIFKGPPGTGKTSTARKIGKLFYDMGFIASDEVITCSVTDLVGSYLGHTGPKVIAQFEAALGRVLFVDEAYRLCNDSSHNSSHGSGNSFHREAVGEIVDAMTKPRYAGNMVVILAGYEREMDYLLSANPGLRSRFPAHVSFPHLTPQHCLQHLRRTLAGVGVHVGDNEERQVDAVYEIFGLLSQTEGWANGRDVETLAKRVIGHVFMRAGEGMVGDEEKEKLVVSIAELTVFLLDMLEERNGVRERRVNGHSTLEFVE